MNIRIGNVVYPITIIYNRNIAKYEASYFDNVKFNLIDASGDSLEAVIELLSNKLFRLSE